MWVLPLTSYATLGDFTQAHLTPHFLIAINQDSNNCPVHRIVNNPLASESAKHLVCTWTWAQKPEET